MWTKKQTKKLEKWLKSKKGIEAIKKISERTTETGKVIDDMAMTWEKWVKIKDEPYNI